MSQSGYTPIQLYRTATTGTAPAAGNLANGELAINYNTADMALYAKNSGGSVKSLMNNPAGLKYPTADGTANQVIKTDGAGNLTFGSVATTTGTSILYGNGSGGFSNVTVGSGLTFVGGTLTATATGSLNIGLARAISTNCILP